MWSYNFRTIVLVLMDPEGDVVFGHVAASYLFGVTCGCRRFFKT